MRHKWQVAKQKKTSKPQCNRKRSYKTTTQAWEAAAFFFVKHGNLQAPYKCPCGDHYHLTTHTNIGNMSHIPEEWRPLFVTSNQKDLKETFWQKLRRFLV